MALVFAAAGVEGGGAAEVSEGGVVAEALGVVAGGDEQDRGALGADAGPSRERGGGLGHEQFEGGVELGDLGLEGLGAAGQHPQGALGERHHVAALAGPVTGGAFEEPVHIEISQLGPDRFGSGGDDAAHLVERLGPGLAS